jgi:hypothetical protein
MLDGRRHISQRCVSQEFLNGRLAETASSLDPQYLARIYVTYTATLDLSFSRSSVSFCKAFCIK